MSLELSPEIESAVREYAEAEGVSINDLLARTFPPRLSNTERDPGERIQALLSRWQQEHGLPPRPDGKKHSTLAELSAEWQGEDSQMTEAERQADRELWEAYADRDREPIQI